MEQGVSGGPDTDLWNEAGKGQEENLDSGIGLELSTSDSGTGLEELASKLYAWLKEPRTGGFAAADPSLSLQSENANECSTSRDSVSLLDSNSAVSTPWSRDRSVKGFLECYAASRNSRSVSVDSSTSSSPPTIEWQWRTQDCKISKRTNFEVGERRQEVFGDFFFKTAYSRDKTRTWLRLHLDELDFGVTNCFNDQSRRGHFIYRVEVEAQPSPAWSRHCSRISAKPSPVPEMFGLQQSNFLSVQLPVVDPRQAVVTLQTGKTISRGVEAFGWSPAQTAPNTTKSVVWSWEMRRWLDGAKFKVDTPARLSFGRLPEVPFDPQALQFEADSFIADASWQVPNKALECLKKIEWGIQVRLHTAYLQHIGILGKVALQRKTVTKTFKFGENVELTREE